MEKRVLAYIEEHKQELFDCLSELIHFDTQNFKQSGRERDCALYIEKLYQGIGLETSLYCPDNVPGILEHSEFMTGRGTDKRPNVSGVWQGSKDRPGVMVAAHIDTMPTGDLEAWKVDPFGGEQRDGRIYGLGSGDNKFGIAGGYFVVKALQQCGVELEMPVVLTSYCDEEHGGGNGSLAACLKYPCKTYVNLDGGNYELWTAALGGGGYRIDLHKTVSTDSCMDVYRAVCAIMSQLEGFIAHHKKMLHDNPMYTGSDMERSTFRLGGFGSTGTNHTDAQLNFVIYTMESRQQVEQELADIVERVRPLLEKLHIVTEGFTPTTRFFIYGQTDHSDAGAHIMQQAAEETSGCKVRECGSCLTDLSLYLSCGSPHSFNFGILRDFALPGGAHQPNEYVECEQFLQHTKALALFLMRYCGAHEKL